MSETDKTKLFKEAGDKTPGLIIRSIVQNPKLVQSKSENILAGGLEDGKIVAVHLEKGKDPIMKKCIRSRRKSF